MKRALLLSGLAALLIAADDPDKLVKKLAGTYRVRFCEIDGKEANAFSGAKFTFKSDKLIISKDGKEEEYTLKATPRQRTVDIDLVRDGKTTLGACGWCGNHFFIALAHPDKPRPPVSRGGKHIYLFMAGSASAPE